MIRLTGRGAAKAIKTALKDSGSDEIDTAFILDAIESWLARAEERINRAEEKGVLHDLHKEYKVEYFRFLTDFLKEMERD